MKIEIHQLLARARAFCPQKLAIDLIGLERSLRELHDRRPEGVPVLDEFFDAYGFDDQERPR